MYCLKNYLIKRKKFYDVNHVYKIRTQLLFKKMMKDIDFSYDIYFRIAVIEEYFRKNDKIWDLYDLMQNKRISQFSYIPDEMRNHKDSFIKLIESVHKNGISNKYPILINEDYLVIDGAHRMACAIYFKIPYVYVYTNKEINKVIPEDYSKRWFEVNDLKDCIKYADKVKEKISMGRYNV